MKTLNDFKNESIDLEKLDLASKIGGIADPIKTREVTGENDSNWNCGDIRTCTLIGTAGGGNVWFCNTTNLQA